MGLLDHLVGCMPSKVKVCAPLPDLSRNFSLTGLVASRPEVGGGASRQSMVFRLSRNTVITILADSPKKKTLHGAPPRFVAGQRAEDRRDHELCKHPFTQRVVFKINSWPPLFFKFLIHQQKDSQVRVSKWHILSVLRLGRKVNLLGCARL